MAEKGEWAIITIHDRKYVKLKRNVRKAASKFILYIALILIAVFCAGPFFWMLLTSLRPGENIYDINFSLSNLSLANSKGLWAFLSFLKYCGNSTVITVGGIAINVALAALCAYPLACMQFYGKKLVFGALLSTMILPNAAGLIVNYLTISGMKLSDSLMGVILPGAVTVFGIILLRQAYLGIPKELIDAAKIDGASEMKTWYSIMLPNIMPAVSTLVIFDFIGRWNSFLWPIVILNNPDKYPLAAALKYLNGMFNYKFGYIAAGTVLSIIPVIFIFVIFQKYFISTLSGAIKA